MTEGAPLILDLIVRGKVLFGQVLKQDSRLRGQGILADDGKYAIASCLHPGSYRFADGRTMLFVRGWEPAADDDPIACVFDSEDEAQEALGAFRRLAVSIA